MCQFVAGRTFEVSWDRKVGGVEALLKGVPQGSLLSTVQFVVWMAPILREMQRQVVEDVSGVGVELLSYVDYLHCGLYVRRRSVGGLDAIGHKERMGTSGTGCQEQSKRWRGSGVCLLLRIRKSASSFAIRQGVGDGGE